MRLRDTLARLAADGALAGSRVTHEPHVGLLSQIDPGGSNPGALGASAYVPADLAVGAPLVVVLHGCTQTAAGYDAGTGWSRLADRAGFAVLFPEQRRANNPNLCFNWFQPTDIARFGGEAESIAQMVEAMAVRHAIDRRRIFVTGLSAGGAMTAVMLATHPDVFAGGAIIGGLPYGCARSVGQALERMAGRGQGDSRGGADAVLRAPGLEPQRWPTVSIWHGAADTTVVVGNMDELAAQWRAVHGVGVADAVLERDANWEHRTWTAGGRAVVESWRIAGMGHGVPIDPAGRERLGSAGPYILAVGVDSTATIARSWGLLSAEDGVTKPAAAVLSTQPRLAAPATAVPPTLPKGGGRPPSAIQAVIEEALRSAGLMR